MRNHISFTNFNCSVSGEVATEPVVSKVSGKVYEKRLIESYLETHDTEPESQDPLSLSDLISLKGNYSKIVVKSFVVTSSLVTFDYNSIINIVISIKSCKTKNTHWSLYTHSSSNVPK